MVAPRLCGECFDAVAAEEAPWILDPNPKTPPGMTEDGK